MIRRELLPHDSAHLHVSGQSEYIDDRPRLPGELDVDILYSPHAHAQIISIDTRDALKVKGVVAIYTARDLHLNLWGTIFKDQPLLADKTVQYVGEAIAVIAAETTKAARLARSLIKVRYKPLLPILNIEQAKKAQSYIGSKRKIERGDPQSFMPSCAHRLSGKIVIRGADHFYLESQASVVYPREDGQLEVHTSSQHPTETQHVVAHALGIPYHDVTCIVKRMGGGFGGKESQGAPFAAYAALVASKLKRPARIILTKDDDMVMTGKRNPFENLYQVGFDEQGRILALIANLYSDGGAYADLSTSIMERAMLHIDNAYFIPHLSVDGQVCKTNVHPHTAFRGFGSPKGVATIERIIEEIAHYLGKDALDIRKLNCYGAEATALEPRNRTHYDQEVKNNMLPKLFATLEKSADYRSRREQILSHQIRARDDSSIRTFRGMSLTPVKFGISFTTRFLNQANAMVIIHRDGTLQVATGATEMGQGVNARIAQLLADEFGLPRTHVRMMPTSTDKNANTSPTAASTGTDMNGAAALLAARKIKERLCTVAKKILVAPESDWAKNTAGLGTQPEIIAANLHTDAEADVASVNVDHDEAIFNGIIFKDAQVWDVKQPSRKIAFSDLINEAYLNRVSLSDYAHYRIPGLSFNKLTGRGDAFFYYTQGVACSEVAVDRDTGEVKVSRSDILMDLGRPIHEGLDVGQVIGAFVQGMGWVTTEKLHYNEKGALLTHAPSTYKIPNIQDTPRIFNVTLLPNDESAVSLKGMKAVGEPPLLLAISVWTAIHDAVKILPHFTRVYPQIEIPATQEEILKSIMPDRFT